MSSILALMGALFQFLGGLAIIVVAAFAFQAARGELDLGAVADWVAGLGTAAGVWAALYAAQASSRESRRLAQEARDERIREYKALWFERYASTLSVAAVAVHRISACQTVIDQSGAVMTRLTILTVKRAVEANLRLVQSVELSRLDPLVSHNLSTLDGVVAGVVDVLDELIRYVDASAEVRQAARLVALANINALSDGAKAVEEQLAKAVAAALPRHGLEPAG